jgi:hypothetical protein
MSANAHLAQDSGSLSQGIFSDHWNSLARSHFSILLETHSAVKLGFATRGQRCKQDMDWPGRFSNRP